MSRGIIGQREPINHSTSFVISTNPLCLDKCPKCGQNICEHTSVADVIHLPNSVSQDFSTYSSDSSLIKQLFSESTTSTTSTATPNSNSSQIANLNNNRISLKSVNQLSNQFLFKNPNQTQKFTNSILPPYTLRPLSCQVMIIDNETTDKLLRDFFDSSSSSSSTNANRQKSSTLVQFNENTREKKIYLTLNNVACSNDNNKQSQQVPTLPVAQQLETKNKNNAKVPTIKKRIKFSNFRLFLKNNNKEESKSSSNRQLLRSKGFVNCLTTSSSSSSSCEEIRTKYQKPKKEEKCVIELEKSNTNELKPSSTINLNQSVISLNSKLTNEVYDEDDYNEIHNLELCPIVASDIDEEEDDNNSNCQANSESSYYASIKHQDNNNNNSKPASLISVPLNNYLFYNYEKKNQELDINKSNNFNKFKYLKEEQKTQQQQPDRQDKIQEHRSSLSSSTITDSNTDVTQVARHIDNSAMRFSQCLSVSQQMVSNNSNNNNCNTNNTENCIEKPLKTGKIFTKNRQSYFSSCSSCDTSSSSPDRTETTKTTSNKPSCSSSSSTYTSGTVHHNHHNLIPPKYHSISIVFMLIGLFSINFLQESFLLFYYFNTEQFYWFIYSVIGLFSGQTLALILSLLTEIDLINLSPPSISINRNTSSSSSSSSTSTSSSSASTPRQPLYKSSANMCEEKEVYSSNEEDFDYNNHYNSELYSIFKHPFSKLFLLVPGYLPISVYIQFFKHVFNYRKSCAYIRFKLEFQLSLYLFFNGLFHSLPLAIINSCYLASTTKPYSLSWYYTELFSIFTSSSYLSSTSLMSQQQQQQQQQQQAAVLFNDNSGLEKRNHLVLLLASVFVSISIGICLFITYYELMKQMNFLTMIANKKDMEKDHEKQQLKNDHNDTYKLETGLKYISKMRPHMQFVDKNNKKIIHQMPINRENETFTDTNSIDSKMFSLGLVEILVYFCYRFCLITSRLSIIALFWYLFYEWLLLALFIHILFGYLSTFLTVKSSSIKNRKLTTKNKSELNDLNKDSEKIEKLKADLNINTPDIAVSYEKKQKSKINQHLTLFIICLLSFIDLFMNQLSELYHIKKVLIYYVIYFLQNCSVLTYWLVRTIRNARMDQENQLDTAYRPNTVYNNNNGNNNLFSVLLTASQFKRNQSGSFVLPSSSSVSSSSAAGSLINSNFSSTTFACYATLIYLCIILFTVFGLILKFLHLHILRKRYRRLYD